MTKTGWCWVGVAAAALAGCSAAGASPDGSLDATPSQGVDGDAARLIPRSPECGDTVDASGSLLGTPFVAGYIYIFYYGGDCPEMVEVVIAESIAPESASLTMDLTRDPGTGSFVAHSTPAVRVSLRGRTQSVVGADVDVTTFPAMLTLDRDAGAVSLSATFSISSAGVSVRGSFTGPLCELVICPGI